MKGIYKLHHILQTVVAIFVIIIIVYVFPTYSEISQDLAKHILNKSDLIEHLVSCRACIPSLLLLSHCFFIILRTLLL